MGEGSARGLGHRDLMVVHGDRGVALELRRPREAARGSCRPELEWHPASARRGDGELHKKGDSIWGRWRLGGVARCAEEAG